MEAFIQDMARIATGEQPRPGAKPVGRGWPFVIWTKTTWVVTTLIQLTSNQDSKPLQVMTKINDFIQLNFPRTAFKFASKVKGFNWNLLYAHLV